MILNDQGQQSIRSRRIGVEAMTTLKKCMEENLPLYGHTAFWSSVYFQFPTVCSVTYRKCER